jgi:uncharacterized protein (DUF1800 family)
MTLTRRAFHAALLGSAVAAVAFRPTPASALAQDSADLFLNRLTFGTTPAERDVFRNLGPEAWLDAQLAPGSDRDLDARLADARLRIAYGAGDDGEDHSWSALDELRPLSSLTADPADLVPLLDFTKPMDYAHRNRPADEVIAASLIRAVHAKAQLAEVMTQFWHDHFNVAATKFEGTAVFFPAYDAMLRGHALGNFRAMLGDVARAPAMLNYLGNADSRASPANENFARELLELHTLGAGNYLNDRYRNWHEVPGAEDGLAEGYIDGDVFEVARAFTGWTIGDGRWIAEGALAPVDGRFHFAESWHDPYQKRILGREFPANRAPMADGEDVLDMLATHPGTARFVCTKIARRLLTDAPDDALVGRMADLFLQTAEAPDQIAQVVRLLALSPEFQAPAAKLRRPFEYLAALLRASGADVVSPEAAFRWELSRAGWRQHEYPPPTGHPDQLADWANTTVLARMVDTALYAHEPWAGITDTDPGLAITRGPVTFAGVADHWADVLGTDPDALRGSYLTALGAGPEDTLPEDPDERRGLIALAFSFAALSPEVLLR